jgi:hypothetical protein
MNSARHQRAADRRGHRQASPFDAVPATPATIRPARLPLPRVTSDADRMELPVLIDGGGIGGLTAALPLRTPADPVRCLRTSASFGQHVELRCGRVGSPTLVVGVMPCVARSAIHPV